jgi:hypothetical protein
MSEEKKYKVYYGWLPPAMLLSADPKKDKAIIGWTNRTSHGVMKSKKVKLSECRIEEIKKAEPIMEVVEEGMTLRDHIHNLLLTIKNIFIRLWYSLFSKH